MKQSAGTLLYRQGPEGLEVLIVHPSGAYNRKAPWSIPKGIPGGDVVDHPAQGHQAGQRLHAVGADRLAYALEQELEARHGGRPRVADDPRR